MNENKIEKDATENDGNQQAVGQAAEPTAAAPVEQAENL